MEKIAQTGAGGMVALGVLVGLMSACVQSIGLTLQRKSHMMEDKMEEEVDYVRRPPYRRRRWQLGMLMFLISNVVGSTIQITTLPLPVLSTLQASGLVFNTACATVLLKEPFTRFSLVGTVLVAIGAVLIALFGAMAEPSHNLDQLLILLRRAQFLVWLAGTFLVGVVILIAIWAQERKTGRPTPRARLLLGLGYGSVSGILSAHCLLVAKSAVELLVRTIVDRVNQFNRWQSWMILLGLVFLALSQLYYLHKGLKLCSTSSLYPFVFCIYNIIAILDGLIYFRQTSRITPVHAVLIAIGTIILLGGVFALSWRLDPDYVLAPDQQLDMKPPARMLTSHSALGPGLGLIDTDPPTSSAVEAGGYRPVDEEAPLISSTGPTETSPLLSQGRSRTTPSTFQYWRLVRAPTRKGSLRPSRLRRFTLNNTTTSGIGGPSSQQQEEDEATDLLWGELNNDDGDAAARRRFSGAYSPQFQRSPSTPKAGSPTARRSTTAGAASRFLRPPALLSLRTPSRGLLSRRLWPIGSSSPAVGEDSTDQPEPRSEDDETSAEEGGEGSRGRSGTVVRRPTWGRGSRSEGAISGRDGWFRLKWWKRRWQGGNEENEGDNREPEDV